MGLNVHFRDSIDIYEIEQKLNLLIETKHVIYSAGVKFPHPPP